MAYVDPFDAATPSGGQLLSLGDDRIREMKRALNERLATFFTNWPDGDPLEALSSILIGLISARPNPPARAGMLFWALDERILYVSVDDAEEGLIWTTGETDIDEITRHADFDGVAPAPAFNVSTAQPHKVLHFTYTAESDGGLIFIDPTIFGDEYVVEDLVSMVLQVNSGHRPFLTPVPYVAGWAIDDDLIKVWLWESWTGDPAADLPMMLTGIATFKVHEEEEE